MLYNQIIFKSAYPYVINNFIREYDLSAANINALYSEGIINIDEYNKFMDMPKHIREVKIGIMSRDKAVYNAIKNGIIKAKKELFLANNIQDHEVVSIKNDAVFVLGRKLQYTQFGNYNFKLKNEYTVFMKLQDLEIYYGDSILPDGSVDVNVDIKGIDDSKIPLHENGMLGLICEICFMLQRYDPKETLEVLMDFYRKFLLKELHIDYYREFNSRSGYIFMAPVGAYSLDYIHNPNQHLMSKLDINRNNLIFRDLIHIVSNIYKSSVAQPR